MIIDQQTLIKILRNLYDKYCNYEHIVIKDVQIEISKYIKVVVLFDYYNVSSRLDVLCNIYIDGDIIVDTKGSIKYGFIDIDFNKFVKEFLRHRLVKFNNNQIIIINKYIKNISISNNQIELELL